MQKKKKKKESCNKRNMKTKFLTDPGLYLRNIFFFLLMSFGKPTEVKRAEKRKGIVKENVLTSSQQHSFNKVKNKRKKKKRKQVLAFQSFNF